jgi:leucyl aminopeptidase
MNLSFRKSNPPAVQADVAVVFLHQDESLLKREMNDLNRQYKNQLSPALRAGDFKAKHGETLVVYLGSNFPTPRLILVGMGQHKTVGLEQYRRAAATGAKRARSLKAAKVAFAIPSRLREKAQALFAFAEGAYLSLYRYDKYLTKEKDYVANPEELIFCSTESAISSAATATLERVTILCEATCFARDLENAPGNELYPETLAKAAKESADKHGYTATILDEVEIRELGMGGILGVSQGSTRPPRFIILEYGTQSKKPVVLVGKGVTFDSGGISIKPASGMAEMKMDMSGAAAVIGAFEAVARLKMAVHLIGLIPSVENMPGGNSLRPGDILRHYNGKTSEVDNTDAEGRLILADALAYAEKFKPSAVIDLATLTGACVVALGHFATGMMGNDDKLMKALKMAGEQTYERVLRLPMFDEYEKLIKSDVADVKNVGGRWAGAITAAWFLKKFIGDYKWVHLDIAGTAILEHSQDYTPKGGSGVGVRLLTELLKKWKS